MSLILDALKQADRERRGEQTPDVPTILRMTREPVPRRRTRLWLCLAVLVIGFGVTLLFRHVPRAPMIGISSEPTVTNATSGLSLRTVGKEGGQPKNGDQVSPPLQKRPSMEIESPSYNPTPSRPMTPPAGDAGSFSPLAAFSQDPETIPLGAFESASDPMEGMKDPDVPKAELSTDIQKDELPLIHDLPLEIQESLKGIEITAHVFNEDPPKRFVFIDRHSYRVGDRIGDDGPLLKEITPDGIVLDYGIGLARLLVNSPGR